MLSEMANSMRALIVVPKPLMCVVGVGYAAVLSPCKHPSFNNHRTNKHLKTLQHTRAQSCSTQSRRMQQQHTSVHTFAHTYITGAQAYTVICVFVVAPVVAAGDGDDDDDGDRGDDDYEDYRHRKNTNTTTATRAPAHSPKHNP